jgi:hypothetical protein
MHRSKLLAQIAGIVRPGREDARSACEHAHQSEASEANLDLAEQLGQARGQERTPPPATDSPVALVQARLAQ